MEIHPAGQAGAERLRGEFRRSAARQALHHMWFRSLHHARLVLQVWWADYKSERPHSSLGWSRQERFRRAMPVETVMSRN
ncbi:integrase core domain-containing protein [Amorphus sp. MBR-141]